MHQCACACGTVYVGKVETETDREAVGEDEGESLKRKEYSRRERLLLKGATTTRDSHTSWVEIGKVEGRDVRTRTHTHIAKLKKGVKRYNAQTTREKERGAVAHKGDRGKREASIGMMRMGERIMEMARFDLAERLRCGVGRVG